MNIGIVGCGRVANLRHLPALARISEARVLALADVDERRLVDTARRFGVERRYASHEELSADREVEVVAVCVPSSSHAEVAVPALEAGKHVLIEKPLALHGDDAAEIARAASQGGYSTVGFNLRHHRLVRQARELVRRGVLGELHALRTIFTSSFDYREEASSWRFQPELGGSALAEMAPHHLDIWRFLLDREVEDVAAFARTGRDVDESVIITGRLVGGVLASTLVSQHSTNVNRMELYGSEGCLRVDCYRYDGLEVQLGRGFGTSPRDRLGVFARTLTHLPRMVARARVGGDYEASYTEQWQAFLASIRSGRTPEPTVEDGVSNTEIVLAAHESLARRGASVAVGRREPARTVVPQAGSS